MNLAANFPPFVLRSQEFDRFDFRNPADGNTIPGGSWVEFAATKGIVASAVRPGQIGTVLLPVKGFLLECTYVTQGHGNIAPGKVMKLDPATGKVHHASASVSNFILVVALPRTDRDYDDADAAVNDANDTIVRVAWWFVPSDGVMTFRLFTGDNDPFEDSSDEIID
jgi:hypothetical protein